MTWDELLQQAKLGDDVEVTLIKPLRRGEHFTKGMLCGFKGGKWGGGWYNGGKSFSSTKQRWIKKPKVYIAYNIFEFGAMGGGQYVDWVDVDNCTFEIIKT